VAGHSRWKQIKHKKAKEDQKKGKIFSRLIREIEVAARAGGPDPQYNPLLRSAVDRARAENMPGENIERAIQRGAGLLPGEVYEEVMYEGYGPEGVAVMVRCLTSNRKRTVGEVRHLFSRYGGTLGESGSVGWIFDRVGVVEVKGKEEEVLEKALEAGAEDVRPGEEGVFEVITSDKNLHEVAEKLKKGGLSVGKVELRFHPKSTVTLSGESAERVLKFLEALDSLDDVQEVIANFEISEAELLALTGNSS
jgi:YebC/PmpR family DNA-binding regulatory protein